MDKMIQTDKYTIYNNDCLEELPHLVDKEIKVDLILTDLPYGVTSIKWDVPIPFKEMWENILPLCNPTTPILLFGTEPFSSHLRLSNPKMYKYDWIWKKPKPTSMGIARYQPMRYHELIHVFYKKWGQYYPQLIPRTDKCRVKQAQKSNWTYVDYSQNPLLPTKTDKFIKTMNHLNPYLKNPSSILEFNNVTSNSHEKVPHPTQKPVKLLEYLIKTYTGETNTILDFTMGSGSTGVAAINTNRKFIGIEINTEYYEIAEKRLRETMKQTKLPVK